MSSSLSKEQKILQEIDRLNEVIEDLKSKNIDLDKEITSKNLIIGSLNNNTIQISTENTELKTTNKNLTTNCQQLLSTSQTYEATIQNQQKKIKEKDILIKEYEKVINNILEKLNIKEDKKLQNLQQQEQIILNKINLIKQDDKNKLLQIDKENQALW